MALVLGTGVGGPSWGNGKAAEVLGTDRLAGCGARPIGSGPVGVALVHGEHGSRAVFHNLQTCGLVWVCPRAVQC